jgi:hypothetical protein
MLNTACFTIDEVGLRSFILLDFFIKVNYNSYFLQKEVFHYGLALEAFKKP